MIDEEVHKMMWIVTYENNLITVERILCNEKINQTIKNVKLEQKCNKIIAVRGSTNEKLG